MQAAALGVVREGERTQAQTCLCRHCGLAQIVPALSAPAIAVCARCGMAIRRVRRDPFGRALAMSLAGLACFALACLMPLMRVSTAGISLGADLFSGPARLDAQGVWELAAVVLFTTVVAPVIKLAATSYVLIGLALPRPLPFSRAVFIFVERMRPWSMVEVYLIGVFVAYVKLIDLVHIDVGYAVYALVGLMLAMVAADATLDRHAVWEALARRGLGPADAGAAVASVPGRLLACETCEMVSAADGHGPHRCPRCASALHARKPNSIARCWALVIAAAILYIPANLYPVLTVVQMGSGQPSTILGGVEELVAARMYPLAAVVFFASIMVPMLKLVGLVILLVTTQLRRPERLIDRVRLYRIVTVVGRWSMIDIFMESILVALVQFGAIVTIEPGVGAVAFAAVVILTIFAAEYFDPRTMWDAANANGETP